MDSIIEYLKTVFPPIIITIIVISVVVFHFHNEIKSVLGDVMHIIGFGANFIDKQASSYRIEGRIGNSVQKVTDNKSILPCGIEVEWNSKGQDRDTFFRRNKVVVVLNKNEPEERQFVRAVMEFVRCGLVPASKVRLSTKITDAADTKVAQSIVSKRGAQTIGYFEHEFLIPFFNHEEGKRLIYDELSAIEKSGMLYQMLLNEFEEVANEALDIGPNGIIVNESAEFLHFVYKIATKNPGEYVPLSFLGHYFKVSVILATKNDIFIEAKDSLDNYISQIQKSIDEGIFKIYIYALGRKIERAKEIARIVERIDGRISNAIYQKYTTIGLTGNYIEGICIELSVCKLGV